MLEIDDDEFVPDRYELNIHVKGLVSPHILSYFGLANIIIGLVTNTISFLIFRFDKTLKKISTFMYLSFIVVLDTLALLVWNLNNFTGPNFNLQIEYTSLFACRFFVFLQYFSLQSSAILLSITTIDRYVTIVAMPGTLLYKLPFSTNRSAFTWSILILAFFVLFNSHILMFNGYYDDLPVGVNETSHFINGQWMVVNLSTTTSDQVYPQQQPRVRDLDCYTYSPNGIPYIGWFFKFWNRVNLVVSSFVPFAIMLVFNILLIQKIYFYNAYPYRRRTRQSRRQTRISIRSYATSLSILAISFLFIILTAPNCVLWGFFYESLIQTSYGPV
jgi:hypothetical protein